MLCVTLFIDPRLDNAPTLKDCGWTAERACPNIIEALTVFTSSYTTGVQLTLRSVVQRLPAKGNSNIFTDNISLTLVDMSIDLGGAGLFMGIDSRYATALNLNVTLNNVRLYNGRFETLITSFIYVYIESKKHDRTPQISFTLNNCLLSGATESTRVILFESNDPSSKMSLVLNNTTISNNKVVPNKGIPATLISLRNANFIVNNCTITHNSIEGPLLWSVSDRVSITSTTIAHNSANYHSLILFSSELPDSVSHIKNCTITNNQLPYTTKSNSHVFLSRTKLYIDSTTVANHNATAIVSTEAHVSSSIFANLTSFNGAVYFSDERSRAIFTNCTMYNNRAIYNGGVAFITDSYLKLDMCNIYNHSAGIMGGVVFTNRSNIILTNSRLDNNHADLSNIGHEIFLSVCVLIAKR
eukprot:gene212-256_t